MTMCLMTQHPIKTSEGLIVITGCSHSGICNITEYAKHVTGINNIVTVIGGFHLQQASKEILEKQVITLTSRI